MGTEESRAKWKNVAKLDKNRYDMDPKLESDVVSTNRHIADAEEKLGVTMQPNFLQTNSDPCWGASCELYATDKPPELGYKINYPVPSFGADPDMEGTMASLASAEGQINHHLEMGTEKSRQKWIPVAKDKDKRYDYYPKLDNDVITTQKNLGKAEEQAGVTFAQQANAGLSFIQTNSDPCIGDSCSVYKLPKEPAGFKKDYFVPNFGADPEVAGVMDSIKYAEKQEKHNLIMGTPESRAKWKNVAKLPGNRYDMEPKLDSDVINTNQNIASAEDKLGVPLVNYQ